MNLPRRSFLTVFPVLSPLLVGCELLVSGETLKVRYMQRELTKTTPAASIGVARTSFERALAIALEVHDRDQGANRELALIILDSFAAMSDCIELDPECEKYSARSSLNVCRELRSVKARDEAGVRQFSPPMRRLLPTLRSAWGASPS